MTITKTRRDYVNDTRESEVDGRTYYVHVYSILTTDLVVVDVLEPTRGIRDHSSLLRLDSVGQVGYVRSRTLTPELDGLPYGDERIERVTSEHESRDRLCERIIRETYPELESLSLNHGHGSMSLRDCQREIRRQS